jgi:fatty-acid desaturase
MLLAIITLLFLSPIILQNLACGGKMSTFTHYGLLVNVAFLLAIFCINSICQENNSKFGVQRGQRAWEALFTY